jgi:SNF2 family DNA or RNA helicase
MESIPKIYNLVNKRKNNMIIVDESHNFRNSNGKRTNELLKLKELMDCKDNLLMSGTPIKEAPDELVPALRMIDPYFTEELGIKYTKTFHTNKVAVANLVRTRFSRAIWRKTKNEVLNLPKKTIESIRLPVKDSNKYLIDVIEEEINTRYHEIYEEKLKENTTLKNKFVDYIWKYSSASKIDTANYIKYITESTNTGNKVDIHSHRRMIYSSFLEDNVYPNIKNERELKELKDIKMKYINMMSISISTAIGEILPPLRTQCYIDLYEENKNYFIKRIKDNIKKTVIFTPFLEVAKHLYEDLNKNKIGCELVIGETKDRMDHINNFKNEDTIDVLIATIQTLSTGVTLTEANQMFFFGLAWRNADNQQCQDRIHRIGQTNEVFIYNVFLLTPEKNLTDRIEEADTRSNEVFNAIINDNDNKLTDINNEDGDPFGNIYYPTNLMPEDKDLFDDIEDDNMGDILKNFLLEF